MTSSSTTLVRTFIASSLLCAGAANLPAGSATKPAATVAPDRYSAYFDAVLPEQMAREGLIGASVAVVQAGSQVFARGYGYQDPARQVPVSADDTLFFIGSDGKLFTWTAVMQLVEQGRLDLHTDVNTYLDFRLPDTFADPITLHHLLTHTAGFEEDYRSLLVDSPDRVRSLGDHVRTAVPARVYSPGSVMAYSNYGSALAGYIVERASGEPFDQYLRAHLLSPLGMTRSWSGLDLPQPQQIALSTGFRRPFGLERSAAMEWPAASPAAPIRTTATDLSRFMLAHLGSGCVADQCILKPESVDLMHSLHFAHPGQSDGMAYGWMSSTINGQHVLWHLGESAHFVSIVALIPDQDLGLFFSFNTAPANWRATLWAFMDTFFPIERPAAPAEPLPDWETRARDFSGLYAPARRNVTSAQALGTLTAVAQVEIDQGRLMFNGWEFVETAPGSFVQVDGDRHLTLRQAPDGSRWLYVGIFAYAQVPWTTGLWAQLGPLGLSLLIGLSAVLVWVRCLRRPATGGPSRRVLGLTGGLALFHLALLVGLGWALAQLAEAYVYDQTLMALLSTAAWLTIPGALVISVVALRGWAVPKWAIGWRIYMSVLTVNAWLFTAWLWQARLIGL